MKCNECGDDIIVVEFVKCGTFEYKYTYLCPRCRSSFYIKQNKPKIVLSGIAGSGKDTFADYLGIKYGFTKIAFADKIYEIAKSLFNMKVKDRWLLQQIGEKMREIDENVWVDYTFKEAKRYLEMGRPVVISDMRRKNEYDEAIKQGFYPVKIVCDKEVAIQRLIARDGVCDVSLLDNEAEIGVRDIEMFTITNNGSKKEFYEKIDEFMKEVK